MNSEDISDDELDDLFRESASEIHQDFDPLAWQNMERRLDEHKVRRAIRKKINRLFILLLVVGTGFWIYQVLYPRHENKKRISSIIKPTPISDSSGITNDKQNADQSKPDFLEGYEKLIIDTPDLSHQWNLNQEAGSTLRRVQPVITQAGINSQTKIDNLLLEKNINEIKDNLKVKVKKNTSGMAVYEEEAIVLEEPIVTYSLSSVPINVIKTDLAQKELTIPTFINTDSIITASLLDSAAKANTNKPLAFNRFSVSLLVAPDLSMVGFTNPGSVNPKGGLGVTYYLNHKWSIRTGLIRSRKMYDAKPEEYNVKGKWKGISAECKVLDLPINIGLKVYQKDKASFTLTTGVSSYFMLYEKYKYEYDVSGSGRKTYEVSNQNRHLLSIYNLSGIYSRQLNTNIYFGMEPFAKVPLTGVGAGKVKLGCVGMLFSISYRPMK